VIGYGGSPIAPALIGRTRQVLPHVELIQVYGLSETGYLTGLRDMSTPRSGSSHVEEHAPGSDVRVVDEAGREVETGQSGELVARGQNVTRGY